MLLSLVLGSFMFLSSCITLRGIDNLSETVSTESADLLTHSADSYIRVTSQEDINVSDHETLTIQNCQFSMTGRVTADDDATIAVRDAELTLSPASGDGTSFVLKGQAHLLVINSTVTFNRAVGDCQIVVEAEAQANITGSTISNRGFIVGHDRSTIRVGNSSIHDVPPSIHSPGVASYETSRVDVENSTVDGVYVWGNSTAIVDRSSVVTLRTTSIESDKTIINITDSHVDSLETFGGSAVFYISNSVVAYTSYFHHDTYAWVRDSSISGVRATGNATVWLIDCVIGEISTEGNARVFIGWNLPFFGPVGMPYSWIPFMQTASIGMVIMGMIAVSYSVYRRKRVREEN